MGRVATILLIIGVVVAPVAVFSTAFLRFVYPSVLFITILTGVLSFAASILFLLTMNRFAHFYQTPAIFRNALYGFLSSFIGGIVLTLVLTSYLVSLIASTLTTYPPFAANPQVPAIAYSFLIVFGALWLGTFLLVLLQGIFYRAAFIALSTKSGDDNFKTAGLLMLIGGGLTIIFVGILVFFVGWIFAAMGFFSMKPPSPQLVPSSAPYQPPTETTALLQKCPNCGATNNEAATYCFHCGTRL